MLTKITIEAALNAEQFELNTPRDRNGEFEPELVRKNQRRFTSIEKKAHWIFMRLKTPNPCLNYSEYSLKLF